MNQTEYVRRLGGIEAKLVRAEEHLETLKSRLGTWAATEQPWGTDRHIDHRKHAWIVFIEILKPPPEWVSVIGGEAIHQMRSALDHLACLAVEHFGAQASHATAFPIEHTLYGWRRNVERRSKWWQLWRKRGGGPLKGIPRDSAVWALIREAQPYHRGQDAKLQPLYVLNDSWNRDKHRQLNPLWSIPDIPSFINSCGWEPAIDFLKVTPLIKNGRHIVDRTAVARFNFPPDQPLPEMKVERPTTFSIAIGSEGPYTGDLADTLTEVQHIVSQYALIVRP